MRSRSPDPWVSLLALRGSKPSQRWYRYNLSRERDMNHRLAHVPCVGRAAFRAQAAVDAHVLVLHHHAAGLLERRGHEQRLSGLRARRGQATLEHGLLVVANDRQAIGRADVDAGVAFDARRGVERRLHVAIEAALDFGGRLLRREPLLHLDGHLREPQRHLDVNHLLALHGVVVVAVGPLVQPHLGARQRDAVRWALLDRHALAVVVDRNRRLMPVLHRPDDVLRAKRSITAEEHAGTARHERLLVNDRHVPLAELDPDGPFDEREGVVLSDREHHGVAWDHFPPDHLLLQARGRLRGPELLELHPRQLAVLDDEPDRLEVVEDLDTFFFRVFQLPRRRLEVLAGLAGNHLHVRRAQALGRPAAVHRGVADADDHHMLADRLDMAEMDRLEPVDADEDLIGVAAARNVELLSAWSAGADEDGVIGTVIEQLLQALDRRVVAHVHAHVGDVADLFVEHLLGEAE